MAKTCKATTKSGKHCPNNASASGFCFTHDPARATERTLARKLGGYHRAAPKVSGDSPVTISTLADVLTLINSVVADAWQLDNSPARARVLLGCADSAIKALEVTDLEARLQRLERGVKS